MGTVFCFRFADDIQDGNGALINPFKSTRSSTKFSAKGKASGIGVGYLIKLTVLISFLMIANSFLVGKLVFANVRLLPDVLDDVRLYQFFQIFVPILMVCVQFWIYDRLKDRAIARGSA